jgi:uncharacterized membrane protein (DUF2068 family)
LSQVKTHKEPRRWPLLLIALDKFIKGIVFMTASFFIKPTNHRVAEILDWLEGVLAVQDISFVFVRVCVVLWAALYLVEAVGLYFEKKWAEWLVIIGTAAFIPLEIYHFIRHPRINIVIVLIVNVAIAAYLLWRLRRQHIVQKEKALLTKQNP